MAYGSCCICVNDDEKSKRSYIGHLGLQEFIKVYRPMYCSGYVNGNCTTNTCGFDVPKDNKACIRCYCCKRDENNVYK